MDEYLDFSFQADRFDSVCKYKSEKEEELYSVVNSIQNNIFNKGTSIKDINDLIKRAVELLRIINEQREVMFRLENAINSNVAMVNDKIGTSERISALTSLENSKKKYDSNDMYSIRDLLFRAMMAIKHIDIIRLGSDRSSFDTGLYEEYYDGLAEIDLDLYYRMVANDKTEDLEKFKTLHDYKHNYTLDDIEELCNPIVDTSEKDEEEEEVVEDKLDLDDEEVLDNGFTEDETEEDIINFSDKEKNDYEKVLIEYAEQLINPTRASDKEKEEELEKLKEFIGEELSNLQKNKLTKEELRDAFNTLSREIKTRVTESLGDAVSEKDLFVDKIKAVGNEAIGKIPEDDPLYEEYEEKIQSLVEKFIKNVDLYDYKNNGEGVLNIIKEQLNIKVEEYLDMINSRKDDLVQDISSDMKTKDDEDKNKDNKKKPKSSNKKFFGGIITSKKKEKELQELIEYAFKLIDETSATIEEKENAKKIEERDIRGDFERYQKDVTDIKEFYENIEILKSSISKNIEKMLVVKDKQDKDPLVAEPITVKTNDEPKPDIDPKSDNKKKDQNGKGSQITNLEGELYYMIFKSMEVQKVDFNEETFNEYLDNLAKLDRLEEVDQKHIKIHKGEHGFYATQYKNGVEVGTFELSWERLTRFAGYKRNKHSELKDYFTYPGRKIQQKAPAKGTGLFTIVVDGHMVFDEKTQAYVLKQKVANKLNDSPSGQFVVNGDEDALSEIVIRVFVDGDNQINIQLVPVAKKVEEKGMTR